jgi:hypothetical protein
MFVVWPSQGLAIFFARIHPCLLKLAKGRMIYVIGFATLHIFTLYIYKCAIIKTHICIIYIYIQHLCSYIIYYAYIYICMYVCI